MWQDDLVRALERALIVAESRAAWNDGNEQCEVEIRFGRILRQRTTEKRVFASCVDETMFLATFTWMSRRYSVETTPLETSTHCAYRCARSAREEIRDRSVPARWVEKRAIEQSIDVRIDGMWIDARVALASERTVAEPTEIVRARRCADAEGSLFATDECRVALPECLRHRARRSMRVVDVAPNWRVDFTHVTTSLLLRNKSTGEVDEDQPYRYQPDTFEIELEFSPRDISACRDPTAAAREAVALIEALCTVVGHDSESIERRIASDFCEAEMGEIERSLVARSAVTI